MPEQSAQERTEDATPRRRQQARRKGTVARSADLTNALVMSALLVVMPFGLAKLTDGFMQGLKIGLANISADPSPAALSRGFWMVLQPSLLGLAILLSTTMVIGVAANLAQVGFVVSGEALAPNLNRLNPLSGLKRIFSFAATFEGFKAVAKSAIFGWLVYGAIRSSWSDLFGLSLVQPASAMSMIGGIVKTIVLRIAIAWLAIAGLDYFFQRKQVDKQLRMSKEEVKQEMKEMEQSPELKAAIAQRRRKLQRRMMAAVKTADAVITNPTHYAIAVKYEPGKQHAPQVVAKGVDFIALKIREEAQKHHVPIVPNPPLARALYRVCEVGDFVPREHFQAVAEVLAYVYKTLKGLRKK